MILRRAGYTLIEMLVSLGIVSVVLVATGSAIVLASRALPDRSDASVRLSAAAALRERIASELAYALAVTELSPTAISFTIADQDNDLADEVVRYAWSGKSGDPVTRQFNGSVAVPVLEDVMEFQLGGDRLRSPMPTTYSLGSEQVLFNFSSQGSADFAIDSSSWPAQYFRPSLPSSAAWWRVTRVSFQARSHGSASGETRVQLRGADALNLPTLRVYDQVAVAESTLTATYAWKEVSFARDVRLSPGQGACIVLQWVRDADACDVSYRSGIVSGTMSRTSDGGRSWLPAVAQLTLQVRGVIATAEPQNYQYNLTNVHVGMRCGKGAADSATYCGSVRLHNVPQVGPP
jgi:prepilin-type N-terminal cleavage/methylation domain-containing protein